MEPSFIPTLSTPSATWGETFYADLVLQIGTLRSARVGALPRASGCKSAARCSTLRTMQTLLPARLGATSPRRAAWGAPMQRPMSKRRIQLSVREARDTFSWARRLSGKSSAQVFAMARRNIGDAAHVMSPIGGVGINYAIQDVVAAANLLGEHLKTGSISVEDLAKVQRRRELPTRLIQRFQTVAQKCVLTPALTQTAPSAIPLIVRFLFATPIVRDLPAKLLAFGFRRERGRNLGRPPSAIATSAMAQKARLNGEPNPTIGGLNAHRNRAANDGEVSHAFGEVERPRNER